MIVLPPLGRAQTDPFVAPVIITELEMSGTSSWWLRERNNFPSNCCPIDPSLPSWLCQVGVVVTPLLGELNGQITALPNRRPRVRNNFPSNCCPIDPSLPSWLCQVGVV